MSKVIQRILVGVAVVAAFMVPAAYGWSTGQVGPCMPLYILLILACFFGGFFVSVVAVFALFGAALFAVTGETDALPWNWDWSI